ncbi:MAG: MlaE family lipid ABC transporter permease subunit [Desulfobacterales bacterium]|nr:MlaE family lipid ABC transporter permease subunit [Desulfobacterales bacterium]
MKTSDDPQSWRYELSEADDGGITLHIQGSMDSSNAASMIKTLGNLLQSRIPCPVTVDLSKVTYLDDFGALVLVEIKKMVVNGKGYFYIENASNTVNKTLSVLNFDSLGKKVSPAENGAPGMLVRLGDAALRHVSDLKYLISFIGSVCLSLIYVCLHPKSLRANDTFSYMQRTGVDALPIVGLISFLLGLIIAFMSSVQLRQFGADIYVASLVSLSMTRELGPIMTAIVVAGRSGSAFAAEIGTMRVSEEIDALTTMGFDPTRFLAVPRVIASVIVVPFLTLFSDVFAIFGGLIVGVFVLNLTANAYIAETIDTLTLFDVFLGFFKGGVFALLIAWIGCLRGFQVRGGAISVGKAATSAVVSSIFLIILFNSIFSVILCYWE